MEESNPILPATNEAVWAVLSLLVPFLILAAIVVAATYFRRLRRSADDG